MKKFPKNSVRSVKNETSGSKPQVSKTTMGVKGLKNAKAY
jgi:hypothetical protein